MRSIFVDFEMNPIDRKYNAIRKINKQEVIEFGAVMLDENNEEIAEFKKFVKPQYVERVSNWIVELTDITDFKLAGANDFATVFEEFLEWCENSGEEYRIYAWSESDMEQIIKELRLKEIKHNERICYLLSHWSDFQKEYCEFVEAEKRISLEKALYSIGQGVDGKLHDALDDARNTSILYKMTRDKDEFLRITKPIKEALQKEEKTLTFTLGDVFKNLTLQMA